MSVAASVGGWGPLPGPLLQTQICHGHRPSTRLLQAHHLGWARVSRRNHTCAGSPCPHRPDAQCQPVPIT